MDPHSPTLIVAAAAEGRVLQCQEGLSFWGGVDPNSGKIIDAHHPQLGESLAGRIVMMPTSRGSCSGSGVLLELAMNGLAPQALVFRETEEILTLGAMVADKMFDCRLAIVRLPAAEYQALAEADRAEISGHKLTFDRQAITLNPVEATDLILSARDRQMMSGSDGSARQLAMEVLCAVAASQGARQLIDVSRAHIDGCIYASPANLTFAQAMVAMGGQVAIPTTMNAISVDRENWQSQNVPGDFGIPASQLADAYVEMGAQPTFTCAPYQSDAPPSLGEDIGWSESNAVIYANSVLGARSVKYPDFLDLFIALTGRAPQTGVHVEDNRRAQTIVEVELPTGHDESVWAMLGWLVGQKAPDRIPLLKGLAHASPSQDDLRAICASFGTTSAAPMLHIDGVTPECELDPHPSPEVERISPKDFRSFWERFNQGAPEVDLIALGSPHFSLNETRAFAAALAENRVHDRTHVIITLSRATKLQAKAEGLLDRLEATGVQIITDLCWCSISEPVFPPQAKTVMTNSGKYAHYGPGLSGRQVRFGSLDCCARAAVSGVFEATVPNWLSRSDGAAHPATAD